MKKIAILCLLVILALSLTGCNHTLAFPKGFAYAIVRLPDNTVVEGSVDKWSEFGYTQLFVTINGIEYLTGSTNVVLINKGE